MTTLVASAERTIAAPVDTLYDYVADFREHHPRILPPAFSDFRIEEGGIGVGTVTSSKFRMGGQTQVIRTRVSRAERNRLIEEVVLDRPMTTTFAFAPNAGGATVRIETTWQSGGGIRGVLERLFAPTRLAKVYADELRRLEAYAVSQQ